MREADVAGADELRRLAGWNQTPEDWQRLLALEPDGCFAARASGKILGTVTTTTYGDTLAWIGMMLVHPEQRRRGIGRALMERTLAYLKARGIRCIKLDATPLGSPLYEKLGFVPESSFTRSERTAGSDLDYPAADTRELTQADWAAVEKIDAVAFGIARLRVLRRLAEGSRGIVVWPAQGTVAGWGMLRSGASADYIGPLACPELPGAMSMLARLVRIAGTRNVFWDVPVASDHAHAAADYFAFLPLRPLTRMRLGPDIVRDDCRTELGIADPSLG